MSSATRCFIRVSSICSVVQQTPRGCRLLQCIFAIMTVSVIVPIIGYLLLQSSIVLERSFLLAYRQLEQPLGSDRNMADSPTRVIENSQAAVGNGAGAITHQQNDDIKSYGLMHHIKMCSDNKNTNETEAAYRGHYLCIRNKGRLGNQMFQYAAIYGLARVKGMCPVVYDKAQIHSEFLLSAKRYQDPTFCAKFRVIRNSRACAFDEQSMSFSGDQDVQLLGYYQSHLYFRSYESEIKQQFKFKNQTMKLAEKAICETLKKKFGENDYVDRTRVYIGMHVRRGDITNSAYYNAAPNSYFDKARNVFRANYSNVLFIVCSDDIDWCTDNLASDDTVFVSAGGPVLDMAVLSMMNHTIMSVGSFGFWAAFLAGGTTIYYKHPANPGTFLSNQFSKNMTDYYYPHWIPMK